MYYIFTFLSGGNPYIAKTENEKRRILRKYKGKTTKTANGYIINDKQKKQLFYN